jgi:hypothetical protein
MSQGESDSGSSSTNNAVVVDLVIGGSSSNNEDLLFDLNSGDSPGGELPKRDILASRLDAEYQAIGARWCCYDVSFRVGGSDAAGDMQESAIALW